MAVSPGGGRVFVTGESSSGRATGGHSETDSETVAYSAATGRRLWVSRYHGPGNGSAPAAMAVSPGGGRVFVTGIASGWETGPDYATVAYSAATGRRLWVSHYHGPGIGPGNDYDGASAVAVSPAGSTVFVTGTSTGRRTGQSDYATVAYSAATGRQLWVRRYYGPGKLDYGASAAAVSPDGSRVFVTGTSSGRTTDGDYATVAYSAATGRQLWVSRYRGYEAESVAVSPDGTTVYVTGYSGGHAPTRRSPTAPLPAGSCGPAATTAPARAAAPAAWR